MSIYLKPEAHPPGLVVSAWQAGLSVQARARQPDDDVAGRIYMMPGWVARCPALRSDACELQMTDRKMPVGDRHLMA
ncbi:hypothetical protein JM66_14165 [Aeromonas bestiarum]|nr:hypothetical protein JM66_14165 [Aeromonas bestiarum]